MQYSQEASNTSRRARASNQPSRPPWPNPLLQGFPTLPMLGSTQGDFLPSMGSIGGTLRSLPSSSIPNSSNGSEWMHQQSRFHPPPPAPRGNYSPLPLVTHPDPHLNPILVPRQGLVYDVRSGPLNAKFLFAESGERWNDQAATVPSVPFMTIVCARFMDPIVVLPMVSTSDKVTVLDVLFAVHKRVHQTPNNPATFSLLEPVGHRGVGRARRDPIAPNWQARFPIGDGGGAHFGSSAVASGEGVGIGTNSVGRGHASMGEEGWMWVGILPSRDEQGVWVLELR
ncbi:hypothetical protein BKA70DRAFT_1325067 [Coprinopsis sp. MPI-PUGE-AT-0042]|nr:hypothetical protein BKA70DRAFT_1325067 [Coprinopsis sp. MPI-PUGE-AT-0042]